MLAAFYGVIMESKIGLKSTKVVSNDSNLELVHHEAAATAVDSVCLFRLLSVCASILLSGRGACRTLFFNRRLMPNAKKAFNETPRNQMKKEREEGRAEVRSACTQRPPYLRPTSTKKWYQFQHTRLFIYFYFISFLFLSFS